MEVEVYSSLSEDDTSTLGTEFSRRLRPGDVVAFHGEIGAGKTEFIKGICDGMNVAEIVSSPTYTVVNHYSGDHPQHGDVRIYHVDLYRIESLAELPEIGLEELLNDPLAIKLVEWSEHAEPLLPEDRYDVTITAVDDENGRKIEIVHRGVVLADGDRDDQGSLIR